MNPLILITYILVMNGLAWDWKYFTSEVDMDLQVLYQGANALKDAITALISTAFMIAVIVLIYQRDQLNFIIKLKERCIEEQAEQYDFMGRANQQSRKFRHDFNKHIEVLSDLADRG